MTNASKLRRLHRVLSLVFTVTVIANFAARAWGKAPDWLTYAPLAPLGLLMVSGLLLFFVPYLGRRRVA